MEVPVFNKELTEILVQVSPIVQSKLEMIKLKYAVLKQLYSIFHHKTGNVLKALKLIQDIRTKYKNTFGEPLLTKAAKVDGRYFWRLGTPGFPSPATKKMHQFEVNRFFPEEKEVGLRTLLFAITNKCPLNCEHCFEWDNLNKKEQLSTQDIIDTVRKYQDYGATQVMFSGGEPMLRINDIYEVLKAAKPGTDFWIITSGLGFSKERAAKLKKLGLTGVMVSLDHFDPLQHNEFRGFQDAWDWARQAVFNANQAGLVTTLALCSTRSFTTRNNLDQYMELAKSWGVTFVQLIEPRATGRYTGKDVELSGDMIGILEETYLDYNISNKYKTYPIINYLGYHQRKVGCYGAGDRFFYIDTDGFAHICPYCSGKVANVRDHSAREVIDLLSKNACHAF
jgi:MoaA/NifB/PqqE/SkfB family radical SAM enzyme